MSAELLRKAAGQMRAEAKARTVLPQGATLCDRSDHPVKMHGHYGYGGRHWCSDFGSPLLSEDNMGSRRVYAKRASSPDAFMLAVADWLDEVVGDLAFRRRRLVHDFGEDRADDFLPEPSHALAVARAYLGTDA